MIYIGNFMYVSNQQETAEEERRHGDFTMIVEADRTEQAIRLFQARIQEYKKSEKFFEGACRIYFTQLLELDTFPRSRAFMLNFKSYAGDPILPFIECAIPSRDSDGCKISDWTDMTPEIDGKKERVFLEFTG